MVGKVRTERFDFAKFVHRNFQPDSRLEKVEESSTDIAWYTDVHQIPLRRLLDRYGGSITKGLTEFQVQRNRHRYGVNSLSSTTKSSAKLWNLIKSLLLGLNSLIWICLILSLIVFFIRWLCLREKPIENLVFVGALLLAIFITTLSLHFRTVRSQNSLTALDGSDGQCALARRNGRFMEIPANELVVGDIVQMSYGDIVPADIRIIESHEFYVDNSGLTGESDPKRRRSVCTNYNPMETKNMAFFSTFALEGFAKGVVVNVGNSTLMGRVAEVASNVEFKADSPVRKELDTLVAFLLFQSLIVGAFFFGLCMLLERNWEEALVYVMTVIVANVPEGLALTSTILFALIAKKLRLLNCLSKNLHGIETLGSTTCICSDKTGTITQNRMAIAHLWFDDRIAQADTSEFVGGNGKNSFKSNDPGFKALARVARLCSRARFKPYQGDKPVCKRDVQGDASEAAILRFMEDHMGNVVRYRKKYKKLYELPFNSRTKLQAYVYELTENGKSQHYLTVKGAPEKLFELCNSILIKDTAYTLDEKWKVKFHNILEKLGSVGDRVIGFADALLPRDKFNESYNYDTDKPEFLEAKAGLRFIGLMSMIDPPRAVVPEAVEKCRKAGVKIVMITGDHPTTATAIAQATGILPPHYTNTLTKKETGSGSLEQFKLEGKVYSGQDLLGLEPHQLDAIVSRPGNLIFARTTPEHKYQIVEALQRVGHHVAVVGDGVNDSPAIKRADVGIVMGITGSEVSKEIGDMVLLDDNFATVMQGIEDGRLGFENLGKLLRYTMPDNIAQMYCSGVGVILSIPKPFSAMAMLITVLGTDILPAVSICYEKMEKEKAKPWDPRRNKLITTQLISHIYAHTAMFQLAAGFFSYFAVMASYGFSPSRLFFIKKEWECKTLNDLQDDIYGQEWTYDARKRLEAHCQAAFFIAIVVMQVANVLTCKGRTANIFTRMKNNWRMNLAICAELALAAIILYVRPISLVTGLPPIAASEWLYPLPFAVLLIICDEVRRYAWRKKRMDTALLSIVLH